MGIVELCVDPETKKPVPDGHVGEVWVSSLSKGSGYWNNPDATAEIFEATLAEETGCDSMEFLRTGDLGFFLESKLYICGRAKDVIIIAGRNYYPNDLEESIDAVAGSVIRPGCSAAFSFQSDQTGKEVLVVACEVRDKKVDQNFVIEIVQSAVQSSHALAVDVVVLLTPRTIPKTTSGKIQRQKCRAAYLEGTLREIGRSTGMLISMDSTTAIVLDTVDWSTTDLADQAQLHAKVTSIIQEQLRNLLRLTETPDPALSMVELGVSSIGMTQLHEEFLQLFGLDADQLPLEIMFDEQPMDVFATGLAEVIRTCNNAKTQLQANKSDSNEENPTVKQNDDTPKTPTLPGPGCVWHISQTLGSLLIVFVASAALIPAYCFGDAVQYGDWVAEPWTVITLWNGSTTDPRPEYTFGLLVPLVIPIWMVSFTFAVILLKWCIIVRLKPGDVPLQSCAYLRWWFVSQLLEFWETWVGYFLSGLFYMNLFYKLLGGKVDSTAVIDTFIREPD
jgi:hypothetical protein